VSYREYTVLYITRTGKSIAEATVRTQITYPESIAYFCRHCGEVWFRVCFVSPDTVWRVASAVCDKHEGGPYDYITIPGCLMEDDFLHATELREAFWPVTLEYAPLEILKREFLLTAAVKLGA